jgi:hypothetical protein
MPWVKGQLTSSSGESLAEQDPQNRSYPRPRKARKWYKKKRPKPSPPSPPLMGVLYAQIKETQQLADHSPTHTPHHGETPKEAWPGITSNTEESWACPAYRAPSTHPTPSPWRELLPLVSITRMSHGQPRLLMDTNCLESWWEGWGHHQFWVWLSLLLLGPLR